MGGMDNDGLHKFTYRLREFFADLLRLVAPALAAELDLDRAEELPTALRRAGAKRLPAAPGRPGVARAVAQGRRGRQGRSGGAPDRRVCQ